MIEKCCFKDIGVVDIALRTLIKAKWMNIKKTTFFIIKKLAKVCLGIKIRQTRPINTPPFGNKGSRAAIADQTIVRDLGIHTFILVQERTYLKKLLSLTMGLLCTHFLLSYILGGIPPLWVKGVVSFPKQIFHKSQILVRLVSDTES